MRFNRKALGARLVANAITSTLLGFVVVPLVALSSPASAYPIPQSQEEYDQYVQEATQMVQDARLALNAGQQNLLNSSLYVATTQEQLDIAQQTLENLEAPRSTMQALFDQATQELADAQYAYDNNLIPDGGVERVPGLRVEIYNQINSAGTAIPPRSTNYNLCKVTTFTHINHNWGGGDIEGCGSDFVMLHYTGYLTVPETTPYGYDFLNLADDGWYMELDGVVVNDNWTLKGCGGWWSEKQHLEAGHSYAIDAWYYEWGGGACSTLYYDSGYNWGVVPASWYSQNQLASYVHDPALKAILDQKQAQYDEVSAQLAVINDNYMQASTAYNLAISNHTSAEQARQEAEDALPQLEADLELAIQILDSIQPYVPNVEPQPEPEPKPTETPSPEPTAEPTSQPTEEPVVEPVPPTAEEVVAELWAEATQDDIVVPEELANIPVLGGAVVALADAINFVGNVGADMTPEVREKSKKVVVSAIIVTQVATQAVATATMASVSASASASTSSGSSASGRRKE